MALSTLIPWPDIGTPEYIKFLLDPEVPLGFHVNVGDPKKVIPERIGALKWMLIARSKVLRVMLYESKMKQDSGFNIPDLDPHTFKNFITFLYGHDSTPSLPFEDSIKLLYAADKYDVQELKDKLGNQIQTRMTSENVFTVLKYPRTCQQVAPLWDGVIDLIQCQTDDLFSNKKFLELSLPAVQFILQQDHLNVSEIFVWKSALRWAQHQGAELEDSGPEVLRELVLPLLKHIRLCTLSLEQFNYEVVLSNVLTNEEIRYICMSMRNQFDMDHLTTVNNTVEKRGHVSNIEVYENPGEQVKTSKLETTFQIVTLDSRSIDLCALICVGAANPKLAKPVRSIRSARDQRGCAIANPTPATADTSAAKDTYRCRCTVEIKDVTDSLPVAGLRFFGLSLRTVFDFDEEVTYGEEFEIPVRRIDQRVLLKPNHKYDVKMQFKSKSRMSPVYRFDTGTTRDATDHFEVEYGNVPVETKDSVRDSAECYHSGTHMKAFKYRVLK